MVFTASPTVVTLLTMARDLCLKNSRAASASGSEKSRFRPCFSSTASLINSLLASLGMTDIESFRPDRPLFLFFIQIRDLFPLVHLVDECFVLLLNHPPLHLERGGELAPILRKIGLDDPEPLDALIPGKVRVPFIH